MTDEKLHELARLEASNLEQPDKKQLRFNDIVRVAKRFYQSDLEAGIRELVRSCDKACPSLYVAGKPMWQTLETDYAWMAPE